MGIWNLSRKVSNGQNTTLILAGTIRLWTPGPSSISRRRKRRMDQQPVSLPALSESDVAFMLGLRDIQIKKQSMLIDHLIEEKDRLTLTVNAMVEAQDERAIERNG